MTTRTTRIVFALAAAFVVFVLACDSAGPQHDTPGALPTARLDVSPRLNASTYVAHGQLLEQQGKFDAAAEQYEQALALTPTLVTARNRLGVVLNRLGRNEQASAEFRRALAAAPHLAYLHNNLGFSLYLEGKYAEAETTLARAVELQPSFRRAHMNRGLALARLGRFEEAVPEFACAVPEAEAHYNVALLQAEVGRYIEAARSLEQALRLEPEFAAAREQLREVSRRAAAAELAQEGPGDSQPPTANSISAVAGDEVIVTAMTEQGYNGAAPNPRETAAEDSAVATPLQEPHSVEAVALDASTVEPTPFGPRSSLVIKQRLARLDVKFAPQRPQPQALKRNSGPPSQGRRNDQPRRSKAD